MRWLNLWLPVVAVCVVIFFFSADSHSMQHSDAMLGWLLSAVGANADRLRHLMDEPFRKFAHVCAYGLLGAVSYRAWGGGGNAWKAWVFCVLYACSDEFHQRFVPTRGPSVSDVMLDSAAALAVILFLFYWNRGAKRPEPDFQPGQSPAEA